MIGIYNGPWSQRQSIVGVLVHNRRQPLSPREIQRDRRYGKEENGERERERERERSHDRSPPVPYWFLAPFKRVVTLVDWPFLNTNPPTMSRRIPDRYQSQTCVVTLYVSFSVYDRFVGDRYRRTDISYFRMPRSPREVSRFLFANRSIPFRTKDP